MRANGGAAVDGLVARDTHTATVFMDKIVIMGGINSWPSGDLNDV